MEINGRRIGTEYPPYIIAEMSNNHLCDFVKAKKMQNVNIKNQNDASGVIPSAAEGSLISFGTA